MYNVYTLCINSLLCTHTLYTYIHPCIYTAYAHRPIMRNFSTAIMLNNHSDPYIVSTTVFSDRFLNLVLVYREVHTIM